MLQSVFKHELEVEQRFRVCEIDIETVCIARIKKLKIKLLREL